MVAGYYIEDVRRTRIFKYRIRPGRSDDRTLVLEVRVPLAENAWFIPNFLSDPEIVGRSTLQRESIELN